MKYHLWLFFHVAVLTTGTSSQAPVSVGILGRVGFNQSLACNTSMDLQGGPILCDGKRDCLNGEDETPAICGCPVGEFNCGDSCISGTLRCDRKPNCPDGRDEMSCETYGCSSGQFKCNNHMCINASLVCNYDDDCGDDSDELNCNKRKCWHGEITCGSGDCSRPTEICDGKNDCNDGLDEKHCEPSDFVTCEDGSRVHRFFWCDQLVHCKGNHADEANCECTDKEYRCPNGRCLTPALVCDGACDCVGDCSDEDRTRCADLYDVIDGYNLPRLGASFLCVLPHDHGELIIGADYICDGQRDCFGIGHSPDETNCPGNETDIKLRDDENATSKYFHCSGSRDERWLPMSVRCNFKIDCLHGEDEQNCSFPECSKEEFQCASKQCVDISKRCDAAADCYDKSDELGCGNFECRPHERKCSTFQCIPEENWCDHLKHCPDGSDETSCVKPTCRDDEFRCANGQCIPADQVCMVSKNPKDGCADKSHLNHCENKSCDPGFFKCTLGPCVNESAVCDDDVDCPNSWNDEDDCFGTCSISEPRCLCWDISANCSGLGLTRIPTDVDSSISKFYFSNNKLGSNLTAKELRSLIQANTLDLSNTGISYLTPNTFAGFQFLKILHLEKNSITVLKQNAFRGLRNLRMLFLQGNGITTIERHAFKGLLYLHTLDLSRQNVKFIEAEAFAGLPELKTLDLSHNQIAHLVNKVFVDLPSLKKVDISFNPLETMESSVFQDLTHIENLNGGQLQVCCAAMHAGVQCSPTADEFSSCEDLMSNNILRSFLWILGGLAILGNASVVLWRLYSRQGTRSHCILITNLAIGDLCMGIYLILIAAVDYMYRGTYALHEFKWRSSSLCHFAGFLSTFSSELTIFILTIITVERFIVISFPLRNLRLSTRCVSILVLLCWILAVLIAVIPVSSMDYFSNFYGRSGVCLALPITADKPSGWEYSFFVFIVLNLVSLCIITICYMWMYVSARCTRRAVESHHPPEPRSRMGRKMVLIVTTDAACWLPIICLAFLALANITVTGNVYAWITVFVLPLNAALNPLLYTFGGPSFYVIMKRNLRSFFSSLYLRFRGGRRIVRNVPNVEITSAEPAIYHETGRVVTSPSHKTSRYRAAVLERLAETYLTRTELRRTSTQQRFSSGFLMSRQTTVKEIFSQDEASAVTV